jgi:hypothetical protein
MASDLTIKRNDAGDVVAYDCTNIPDTVASAKFTMTLVSSSTPTINKATASFTASDADSGRASYTLTAANTATKGRYNAEFELTLDGGGVVTYPANGYISISIQEDLA